MTVRVGVIGTGMIGADHMRRLTTVVTGSRVVAVTDVDAERARRHAEHAAARVYDNGNDLIAADEVDAVLVASWAPTHEEYVLACVAAGKPVFCEKPLATNQAACRRILDAEVAAGRRLVQVGFMRRYDPAYRMLRAVLQDGEIGAPTLVYSVHRNANSPADYASEMLITDTAVHDIDIARWLLGEEIVATRVLTPRHNRRAAALLSDPLIVVLETESGVLVNVEVNVNVGYGYDIRGEVVGERGTVALGDTAAVVLRTRGQRSAAVPADWGERFARAYDLELQDWADSVRTGRATGPSVWDGYAVSVVSDAAVSALHTGERVAVRLIGKPPFYEKD